MNIHTRKRAMFMRSVDRRNAVSAQEPKKFALSSQRKLSVLLVVGIVILSAKECEMGPMGPGGDKPVTFAYICPNGTVTAGTAPAKNTEKCSACNTGFNLTANTCVASPGTIAYICTNGAIAEGIAGAEDTEKCSACDEGFNLTANTCVASAPVVSVPVYQHPLASTLVPAGPFSLASSAKVSHSATLASSDNFGRAVAFAGDLDGGGGTVLAVGAQGDDTGGSNRGAIYLLSYNPAGVLQTTKKIAHEVDETNAADTLAPTLADVEGFGSSIANAGDLHGNSTTVLAVGATRSDAFKGAIYLLSFNASGSLTVAPEKISSATPNGPAPFTSDEFGTSIANAGDLDGGGGTVLAVGAQGDTTGGSNRGAIYLLSFSTSGSLTDTKKIRSGLDETNAGSNSNAPSLANQNRFGFSIANAGDLDGSGGTVLAIGASGGNAIHLLSFSAAGVLQSSKKIASGLDETNTAHTLASTFGTGGFGSSIANAGNLNGNGGTVLFVGANSDDTDGTNRGAIYLLSFSATGSLTAIPTKIASGTDNGPDLTNNYFFGTSLASAGNLDGNGGRVLAVGGIGDSAATNKTGELQLLYFTPPAED